MSLVIELVLNSLGIGGAERHSVVLANALHADGLDVRVVALGGNDALRRELHPAVAAGTVTIERRAGVDLRALARYRQLVNTSAPALTVTVNQYPLAFVSAATLGMSRRAPVLHVSHTIELPHEASAAKWLVQAALKNRPQAQVYVCERQRSHWRAKGIAVADHCIHNGVDITRFAPITAQRRRMLRSVLAVPESALLVGLCAGLRTEKRHDLLLDAVAEATRRGQRVHALLIGDGPHRAALEAQAHALGIDDAVSITGYQNDVRPWVGACDCMCLVSDHETFSLAVLEGMAMGLPVVATRVGAVDEQITDAVDGLLVPAGSVAHLADAMQRLADPALRETLGQRARAKAEAWFDERRMTSRYVRLVRECARPAAAKPAHPRPA